MKPRQVYEEMRLMLLRLYHAEKMTWSNYRETTSNMYEALKYELSKQTKE